MAEQKLLVKREGDFHYPIYFEKAFSGLAQAVREEGLSGHKICVVTDSHVEPLYLKSVMDSLQEVSSQIFSFVFEAGEKIRIWTQCRNCTVLLLNMKWTARGSWLL